jgi:hypothetical protein
MFIKVGIGINEWQSSMEQNDVVYAYVGAQNRNGADKAL